MQNKYTSNAPVNERYLSILKEVTEANNLTSRSFVDLLLRFRTLLLSRVRLVTELAHRAQHYKDLVPKAYTALGRRCRSKE